MPEHDDERELQVLISYLLNRPIAQKELIAALGIAKSTYLEQYAQGRLLSGENLRAAARYFGINPLELLVYYSWLSTEEVRSFYQRHDLGNPTAQANKEVISSGPDKHLGSGV